MSERDLFIATLQITDPAARAAWLDQQCGGEATLRQRLAVLLQAHDQAGSLLDNPVVAPPATTGYEGQGMPGPDASAESLLEGPGKVIGLYKLLEQIGEGGFGVVFLAEQTQPVHRKVALKVLKPGMGTRQVVARFEAERQALAIMDHPHIAKVFDGGATPSGRPYFVMELVKGVPITAFCDQNQLTPRQRLELFLPVCQAVQHAHQKGIIHRDLKPSNVLVSRHDTTPTVKVIDFGVAKALGQQLTDKTLFTGIAQMIGTPLYMSPEQAGMSDLDVDTRSDIYSLGVLLYELLTGTTPFTKERFKQAAYDEIRRIIREEEPPKPSTRLSESKDTLPSISAQRHTEPAKLTKLMRGELDWIVMKALEKDRNRRYETANDFALDVQRYLHDDPVLACPPSAWYRCRKFARRQKGALVTATLAVVALLAVVAVFISGALVTATLAAVALLAVVAVVLSSAFTMRLRVALDDARQARTDEERQRHKAELFQYFHHIARAHAACQDGNMGRVKALLEDCPASHAQWEWYYLERLCHADLRTLAHEQVFSLALSPDGTRIASAGFDRTIKIWETASGRELLTLRGHADRVRFVAFSPDGQGLASSSFDGTVRVWDISQGREVFHVVHAKLVSGVAFSPDGSRLASAGGDSLVRIWDARTGRETLTLAGHCGWVNAVAFSPDGTRLASAGVDKCVMIWDLATGRAALPPLQGHTGWVLGVAFSPDGTRLASASADNTVQLWEIEPGRAGGGKPLTPAVKGHTSDVWGVAFSPDGTRLASTGVDQTVRVWDVTTGQLSRTLKGHSSEVTSAAFSPDGTLLVSASPDGTVKIWDAVSAQEAHILGGHEDEVWSATFSPNGTQLASASADGSVKVWDASTRQQIFSFKGHAGAVRGVAFRPDGRRLASAGEDGTVRLWDAVTGQTAHTLQAHRNEVWSVAFSPDGARLASASQDGTVRLWDVAHGQELLCLQGSTLWIQLAFSPDGTRLASAGEDDTVKLWDVSSGQETIALQGHTHGVWAVAFSPDGTRLASGSSDNTVKLWDLANGRVIFTLKGYASDVYRVMFSPNGARLASGSRDGTIKLWDVASGQEALTLRGHANAVFSVAFSPEGSRLASASGDGTVRIWDAQPRDPETAVENEALALLAFLFASPLCRADVIEHVRNSPTISPQARSKALSLVERYREETDPERFHRASRVVASRRYLNAWQYRLALRQADTACRLAPEQGKYRTTLAMAQYRAGQYPEALATLTQAEQRNQGGPADLTFLAMAQHRHGQKEQAQATLVRLRQTVKAPPWARDQEAEAFLREAEALLELTGR